MSGLPETGHERHRLAVRPELSRTSAIAVAGPCAGGPARAILTASRPSLGTARELCQPAEIVERTPHLMGAGPPKLALAHNGSDEQMFGAKQQIPHRSLATKKRSGARRNCPGAS